MTNLEPTYSYAEEQKMNEHRNQLVAAIGAADDSWSFDKERAQARSRKGSMNLDQVESATV